MGIYQQAADQFRQMQVRYPDYMPLDNGIKNPKMLSNKRALAHTRNFFAYGSTLGLRGTPHKL